MIFRRANKDRSVFSITDDDSIGSLDSGMLDDSFDDALAHRSASDLFTGSYLGNFPAQRVRSIGAILLSIIFTVFFLRIGNWQILKGDEYRIIADNNRTRTKIVIPNRGVISDRNGQILAWNTPEFHLIATRTDIPMNSSERFIYFENIVSRFHIDGSTFEERYNEAVKDATVLLAEDVPYTEALAYMSEHGADPSLMIELASTRSYITNNIPTLSHVIGFTGPIAKDDVETLKGKGYRRFDSIGKQGIEAVYESMLRGTPGVEVMEVDAQGKIIRTLQKTDAMNGEDLTLSIDAGLTAAIENVLSVHLAKAEVKRAAVVVSDPKTGEILSLVSYPSFDANLFARGITQEEYNALLNDPNAPLFPRATQGEYPSGSTIKPVYAAAALMEGIITPSTSFLSTGGIWLGGRLFPDWRKAGHGVTNVYKAIADSVNTFFYIIGGGNGSFEGLGIDRLMSYAKMFGFGSPSGIDLPNEASGFLPSKEWKEQVKNEPWYIGDTYNVSIGQGDFLVTPLQMNRSTATFANGGTLMASHMVKDAAPEGIRIVPEDIATIIQDAMRETVTWGSATTLLELSEPVAGKTGTAQWATGRDEHTWFTGFGPFNDPKIVVTVIVEQGGGNYYATPIAKDIFAWWFANRID